MTTPYVSPPPGTATYAHLTAGSTLLKTGVGSLQGVDINTAGTAGATVTLYDGTSSGGTEIAVISAAEQFNPRFGVQFTTGLYVALVGTPDVTVCYA
jgi:hypothetical protein